MNLNNLRLGARLTLGFGAVLALSLVMVVVGYWRMVSIDADLTKAQDYDRRSGVMAEWMGKTELNITRAVAIAKGAGLPALESHFGPQMKETTAQINELQKELDGAITSEKGKALLADIGTKRKEYIDIRGKVGELTKQGDPLAAETMLKDKMLPAAAAYLGSMRALSDFQADLAKQNIDEVHAMLASAEMMLVIMLAISLGVGAAMAWAITRSVTGPLQRAVTAAQTISKGDLSESVSATSRDELGDLLRAIGTMQDSLRNLVGRVRSSTDSISTASVQIATGNQDLSARTEQTASNLQQAASSMEELSGTVKQSADSARQANQLAASAAEVAQRGGTVVSQVVSTMDEINASSKKIADIIGVIDGIAFQTNILALNAAVEAARA
ncbi:methyl-accepting chemotaxis protein, partial [Variovorax sp. YR752]|uniref:methyl-accepting chemotaxis protein n=1 Tax=Variovorax sp. YR752 TaxID=1884383 RepID=UPI0031383338